MTNKERDRQAKISGNETNKCADRMTDKQEKDRKSFNLTQNNYLFYEGDIKG